MKSKSESKKRKDYIRWLIAVNCSISFFFFEQNFVIEENEIESFFPKEIFVCRCFQHPHKTTKQSPLWKSE